jgi:hypothetical protein
MDVGPSMKAGYGPPNSAAPPVHSGRAGASGPRRAPGPDGDPGLPTGSVLL